MKASAARLLTALAVPALSALGGAFTVFSGYDDAPGGVLIGLLLIIVAAAISWRSAQTGR